MYYKYSVLIFAVADPGISNPGDAVEFLESRDCFDVLSHIPYVFVARVFKRINYKLNEHCMLGTIKVNKVNLVAEEIQQ